MFKSPPRRMTRSMRRKQADAMFIDMEVVVQDENDQNQINTTAVDEVIINDYDDDQDNDDSVLKNKPLTKEVMDGGSIVLCRNDSDTIEVALGGEEDANDDDGDDDDDSSSRAGIVLGEQSHQQQAFSNTSYSYFDDDINNIIDHEEDNDVHQHDNDDNDDEEEENVTLTEHKQALENLNAQWESNKVLTTGVMNEMDEKHDDELRTLQICMKEEVATLESTHAYELQRIREEHANEVDRLKEALYQEKEKLRVHEVEEEEVPVQSGCTSFGINTTLAQQVTEKRLQKEYEVKTATALENLTRQLEEKYSEESRLAVESAVQSALKKEREVMDHQYQVVKLEALTELEHRLEALHQSQLHQERVQAAQTCAVQIEQTRRELESEYETEMEKLMRRIDDLSSSSGAVQQQAIQDCREQLMTEQVEAIAAAVNAAKRELAQNYNDCSEELTQTRLQVTHLEEELSSLRTTHSSELDCMKESYERETGELQELHRQELQDLHSQMDHVMVKATEQAQEQVHASVLKLQEMEAIHDDAIKRAVEKATQDINDLHEAQLLQREAEWKAASGEQLNQDELESMEHSERIAGLEDALKSALESWDKDKLVWHETLDAKINELDTIRETDIRLAQEEGQRLVHAKTLELAELKTDQNMEILMLKSKLDLRIDDLKSKHQTVLDELETSLTATHQDELQKVLAVRDEDISNLNQQLTDLQTTVGVKDEEIQQVTDNITSLQADLDALKTRSANVEQTAVEDARRKDEELAALTQQYEALLSKLAEMEQERGIVQREKLELEEQLASRVQQVEESRNKVTELERSHQERVAELKRERHNAELEFKQRLQETRITKQDVSALHARVEELSLELATKETMYEKLRADSLTNLEAHNNELQRTREAAMKEATDKAEAHKAEVDRILDQLRNAETKTESLQCLAEADQLASSLSVEIDQQKSSFAQERQATIDSFESQIDELRAQHRTQLQAVESQRDELVFRLEMAKEEAVAEKVGLFMAIRNDVEQLNRSTSDAEVDSLRLQLEKSTQRMEEVALTAQNAVLERDAAVEKAELAANQVTEMSKHHSKELVETQNALNLAKEDLMVALETVAVVDTLRGELQKLKAEQDDFDELRRELEKTKGDLASAQSEWSKKSVESPSRQTVSDTALLSPSPCSPLVDPIADQRSEASDSQCDFSAPTAMTPLPLSVQETATPETSELSRKMESLQVTASARKVIEQQQSRSNHTSPTGSASSRSTNSSRSSNLPRRKATAIPKPMASSFKERARSRLSRKPAIPQFQAATPGSNRKTVRSVAKKSSVLARTADIRILMLAPVTPQVLKMGADIKAYIMDSLEEAHLATHVVIGDTIRRTPKLMVGLSVTSNLVSMDWLIHSSRNKKAHSTAHYLLLNDSTAEDKYDFSMRQTLKRGVEVREAGGLLYGWHIVLCDGVAGNRAPPEQEMKLLVKAAGGSMLSAHDLENMSDKSKVLIITSNPPTEEQLSDLRILDATHNGARIFTLTWLFGCFMQQRLMGV